MVLAPARRLLRSQTAQCVLTVGQDSPRLEGFHASMAHIVVTVGDAGWHWPTDKSEEVGELLVRDRSHHLEISLLGWWSPVGVAELVGMPHALMAMSLEWGFADPWAKVKSAPVLRLDPLSATVSDGRQRIALDPEAMRRELLP